MIENYSGVSKLFSHLPLSFVRRLVMSALSMQTNSSHNKYPALNKLMINGLPWSSFLSTFLIVANTGNFTYHLNCLPAFVYFVSFSDWSQLTASVHPPLTVCIVWFFPDENNNVIISFTLLECKLKSLVTFFFSEKFSIVQLSFQTECSPPFLSGPYKFSDFKRFLTVTTHVTKLTCISLVSA